VAVMLGFVPVLLVLKRYWLFIGNVCYIAVPFLIYAFNKNEELQHATE
jgi:hypothetical protein